MQLFNIPLLRQMSREWLDDFRRNCLTIPSAFTWVKDAVLLLIIAVSSVHSVSDAIQSKSAQFSNRLHRSGRK
jgi:hypothetical protein